MKKNIFTLLLLMLCVYNSHAQIGTPNMDPSAVFELSSSSKGFLPPRLTTVQRQAIVAPVVGLTVYNTTIECLEWYNGSVWFNACDNEGEVSAYDCNISSGGAMTIGVPAAGVTQTIRATVTKLGSYNITATNNGVTFTSSGVFTSLGDQDIVLLGFGSPIATGTHNFAIAGTPTCTFTRTTAAAEGASSGYICNTASTGTMTAFVPVAGVTQTITATVTTLGTYSINATANGVTFSGSGTFTALGAQTIVLTASGTPIAAGPHDFVIAGTPSCTFTRVTGEGASEVSGYVCNTASAGTMTAFVPVTGVTQTITATVTRLGNYDISATANGVTFRAIGVFTALGNQPIELTATGTPAAAGNFGFTLTGTPNCSFTRPTVDGVGIATGFVCNTATAGTMTAYVPVTGVTQTITATVTRLGSYDISAVANGVTFRATGTYLALGAQAITLTATGTPAAAGTHTFTITGTPTCSFDRVTAGGVGASSGYVCTTASAGTMTAFEPVTGVTQTITATVTRLGSYDISAVANGVTFRGTGAFTGLGAQIVVLTATGTPAVAGTHDFVITGTPTCTFTRVTGDGVGTASGYVCDTRALGMMTRWEPVTGVSQTITATVTRLGTYDITAAANGVTYSGTGVYTALGAQEVVLTATGIPTVARENVFVIAGTPSCSFQRFVLEGASEVSGYVCNTATAGTMTAFVPVGAGVTQTITATVTRLGNYDISATANGVTFSATGTYTTLGAQTVVLTATGTPTAAGTHNFVIAGTPSCTFTRVTGTGASEVSGYVCNTASTGTMTAFVPVTGVNQTITATVTRLGSYDISAVANGVTFHGTGTYTALGAQTVVLTATGTPAASGTHAFTITGTPTCTFNRVTGDGVGTASGFVCNTASAGDLTVITPVAAGVTQTITATVTRLGNYDISATANGVTFRGTGTYTALGAQAVVLTATGTPTAAGTHNFVIAGTPSCTFTRVTVNIPDTVIGPDGRVWMDRNLGAPGIPTAVNQHTRFGGYFQWGRKMDGHEVALSAVTGTRFAGTGDSPAHSSFIITGSTSVRDWRVVGKDDMWTGTGTGGVNNPCPAGFRVPTEAELDNLFAAGRITNNATAWASILKIPTSGFRFYYKSEYAEGAIASYIWTSTTDGTYSRYKKVTSTATTNAREARAWGFIVRCLRN